MSDPHIGQWFGPYQLVELLGEGGAAAVYQAYQPAMDRWVAVKVIRGWIGDDPGSLERFQREARVIARLEHPNILPVYDYNGTHQPPYIVMRLVKGTLEELLKGRLTPARALNILQQVALALDHAHAQGIIHRDIKPSNIMLDEQEHAYLADFGLARPTAAEPGITQTGFLVGTPGYMAPEQGMGAVDIGPAVDIYALGVVLFEMLAGQPPYQADTPFNLLLKQIQEPPPDICTVQTDLPGEMNAVLQRALRRSPEERFSSAVELIDAALAGLGMHPSKIIPRQEVESPAPVLLNNSAVPLQVNKQVTVMVADASEYENVLSLSQDIEDVSAGMRSLWQVVDQVIAGPGCRGGIVARRSEKTLTMIWGAETAHEDDPEKAIWTALALRDAVIPFAVEGLIPLQIGLDTGMVQLTLTSPDGGEKNSAQHSKAAGPALVTAARLPAALPDGGVAVTQAAYRLVQGVFDVAPLPSITVRGVGDLTIHKVVRAKPVSLRIQPRSVEGIDTRMIGRDAELLLLQNAVEAALDGEAQLVSLTGEAGSGKSRLLYSLFQWIELKPEYILVFRGRVNANMTAQPYSLLHEVLSFRFEIRDSDPQEVVQQKLELGVRNLKGTDDPETAHFIGQLAGFDLSESPYLKEALEEPEFFRRQATSRCISFLKASSKRADVEMALFELEDVQWADAASLDLFSRLVQENPESPIMVVFSARPSLFERLPQWESGQSRLLRIHLRPLSRRDSRRLVREILQKLEDLPESVQEWLVERAEGSPLFMEELVRRLVELRVIVKEEPVWKVFPERIPATGLPSTLTGMLQSRIDSLGPDERVILQRAAVYGRMFWKEAVAALECADQLPIDVEAALESLLARDFIKLHDNSPLQGFKSFSFNSSLMRDVAYEAPFRRVRCEYHRAAAHWLIQTAGERHAEFGAIIASHWESAGEAVRAADAWLAIGRQGVALSAYPEALAALNRALVQNQELDSPTQRIAILNEIAEIQSMTGKYAQAQETLQEAARLGKESGDPSGQARALSALGRIMYWLGSYPEGLQYLQEAELLARAAGDQSTLIFTLRQLGNLVFTTGDLDKAQAYMQESLVLALNSGDSTAVSLAYSSLGMNAMGQGNYGLAVRFLEAGLGLDPKDRSLIGLLEGNLSCAYIELENWSEAEAAALRCLAASQQIGNIQGEVEAVENLGICLLEQGQMGEARQRFLWTLNSCYERQVLPHILDYLPDYAHLLGRTGQIHQALSLLGLSLAHPVSQPFTIQKASKILARLKEGSASEISSGEIEKILSAGASLDLDSVMRGILNKEEDHLHA
jgi:serine/threonine protein kinase/tetratricopeptide (TPR) repeat protein